MNNPYDLQSVKTFMQKAEAYAQLNILCPFLKEGTCSIYPVRPFVCSEYVVSSPSEKCKPSIDNMTIILKGAYSREIGPPYFRGPKENLIYSPAALLVYQIIANGFIYLNDLPSLKGIEDEVFSESRIQLLFKKFFPVKRN
jgi:Fe-S-cluster containining protein